MPFGGTGLQTFRAFFRTFSLDGGSGASYYRDMDNTPDYTSDLPDSFDPSWDEDIECDEFYETSDADWWESAYGPADDGGWAF